MKNSKIRRALLLAACAVLLVCMSVGATLAYLTSQDQVTNTFTVGKVKITLDELDVDANGDPVQVPTGETDDEGNPITEDTTERVKANEYHLLPNHEYMKDPIVHVDADSDDCWLFVDIKNEIAAIQDDNATIHAQMEANGWSQLTEGGTVYAYATTVAGGTDVPVFEMFKVAGDVANEELATYAGKTIVVTAYAVQADGFDTAAAAWTATFGAPKE